MAVLPPKCLTPYCTGEAAHRGLCKSCYNVAGRLVRNKETTWEQLIKLKLATPPFLNEHGPQNRFLVALEHRKANLKKKTRHST